MRNSDPHADQPILSSGSAPEESAATLIMIHGRGASAQSILSLYHELGVNNLAAIAPQAAGNTWYPYSFLESIESNQPYLDSALAKIESLVTDLNSRGVSSEHIAILGFSQGACLTLEFAARHPRRYGAIIGLTGGLIGPVGTPRNYPGSLAGTPVFLGSGDPDPHIPFSRAIETRDVLGKMGADFDLRRYPGMSHTISEDELDACRELLNRIVTPI